jgi:hypothetical protein
MKYALISGFAVILTDFFIDLLVFHRNRGLVYVLNINLSKVSLWNSFLIVLSFTLFGYIMVVYRSKITGEREDVDGYILKTIEATDALRYNLYSMRLAIHSSNNDFDSTKKVMDSVEEGLKVSIDLIDSYLENAN